MHLFENRLTSNLEYLHKNSSTQNLLHWLAARPRIELRLDLRLGGISNPLGYHYPTAPYERDYNLKSLPGPRRPIFIYIPLLVISNVRRRRRAGLMAIRADFWRQAEVPTPTRVLAVPTVFKTVLTAGRVNLP